MDKKIKINYISGLISTLIIAFLGFFKMFYIIHKFGDNDNGFYFGVFALTTLVSFFESTLTSSFASRLANLYHKKEHQEFDKYYSMSKKLFHRIFIFTTLLFVFLAIILPIVDSSYLLHNNKIESTTLIFFTIFPSISLLYRAHLDIVIFSKRETYITNWKKLITYIISFGSIVIFANVFNNLAVTIVLGTILTTIFEVIFKFWLKRRYKEFDDSIDVKVDNHIISDMKYTSMLSLITRMSMSLDAPVIQHVIDNNHVSYFNTVKSLISAIPQAVINPLIRQFSAKLYKEHTKGEEQFNKSFAEFSLISHLLNLLIYIPIMYLFTDLIYIIKPDYVKLNLFPYVILSSIVNYFWWQAYRFNSVGYIKLDYKFLIKPNLIAFVLNLVGSIYFTMTWGAYGVWIGSLIQWIILFMIFSKTYYKYYLKEWIWAVFDVCIMYVCYYGYNFTKTTIWHLQTKTIFKYILSTIPTVIVIYIMIFIIYFIFIKDFRHYFKYKILKMK